MPPPAAAGRRRGDGGHIAGSGVDGRPRADAVVFLEPRDGRPPAVRPATGVEIEQAGKPFAQRVTVVPVGTEVAFPNRDRVRHHVHSFSPAKPFELKLYAGTPANPVRFDKPGIALPGCNTRDQMVAWVVVVETPHYARTDAAGMARLDGVAAGAWRRRSWHPALPPGTPAQEQALVVAAGGSTAVVRLAQELAVGERIRGAPARAAHRDADAGRRAAGRRLRRHARRLASARARPPSGARRPSGRSAPRTCPRCDCA